MKPTNTFVTEETTQVMEYVVRVMEYFEKNDPNEYYLENPEAIFYPLIDALKLKAGQEVFDEISSIK